MNRYIVKWLKREFVGWKECMKTFPSRSKASNFAHGLQKKGIHVLSIKEI